MTPSTRSHQWDTYDGRSPSGSGSRPTDEAAISVASSPEASIPNAVTIPGELYAFLMGEAPLQGVWFGELNEGFRGAFWWRGLLRCAAGWPNASAGEAGTAETPKSGSVHEHAVPNGETPITSEDHHE
jgi:hypothetical protein